jgi:Undecaprenyl-phosphate glucose phosphotransferase
MLRNHEKLFAISQKLIDFIVVCSCWFLAYFVRFTFHQKGEEGLLPLFLMLAPILGSFTLYFFYKNGLYRSWRFNSKTLEIMAVVKANVAATFLFIIFLYFFANNRLSRMTLAYHLMFSTFGLILIRMMVRNFLRNLRKKGFNLRHLLLVGNGPQMRTYVENVKTFKDAGIQFIGWVQDEGMAAEFNIESKKESVKDLREKFKPDAIIIGLKNADSHQVEILLKENYNEITPIQVLPDISYAFIGLNVEDFAGLPILNINQPTFSGFELFIKRSFDFILTLIGLIFVSPLLVLIALGVKLTSRGPVLYGQPRMGLDGKSFTMWKFRSMRMDGEYRPGWTVKDDPRRTAFGTFLRSTSLDELPQLWNVLIGNMSLVGPRPEQPFYVAQFKEEIPAYMLRHKMRAGITGWAQVNGWRGDTSLHKRIECDLYYIRNWSLWLDAKILFLTFWRGFINKNAY